MNHQIVVSVVLGLAAIALTSHVDANKTIARVVSESQTDIRNVPYLVQLRHIYGDLFLCSGTLVTNTFVVTAAHCVSNVPASNIMAVGGAAYLHEEGIQRTIVDSKIHPKYDSENPNSPNDVAVLKLLLPMAEKNIRPVPLCAKPVKAGQLMHISGWGKTYESGGPDTAVRTIRVPALNDKECREQYGNGLGDSMITDTMFCADMLLPTESCQDDTGGPAIFSGELCGFLSWGNGCIGEYHPGVYTNVFKVRKFIGRSIKEMLK